MLTVNVMINSQLKRPFFRSQRRLAYESTFTVMERISGTLLLTLKYENSGYDVILRLTTKVVVNHVGRICRKVLHVLCFQKQETENQNNKI